MVQSIEALRLLKAAGLRPERTVRTVLFMNEENGVRGGQKYAEQAQQNKETPPRRHRERWRRLHAPRLQRAGYCRRVSESSGLETLAGSLPG
ncbi:MAG: M28 family peptidase [Hymenobacter sp.]